MFFLVPSKGASSELPARHEALCCRFLQSVLLEEVPRQSDARRRPRLQHLSQLPGHFLLDFLHDLIISQRVAVSHATRLESHPITRPMPHRIPLHRLVNLVLATISSQPHQTLHDPSGSENRNAWPRLGDSIPSLLIPANPQRVQTLPVLVPVTARDLASFCRDIRRNHVTAVARVPRLPVVQKLVEDAALGESHGAAVLADVQGLGVEDEFVGCCGEESLSARVDADDRAVFVFGCHYCLGSCDVETVVFRDRLESVCGRSCCADMVGYSLFSGLGTAVRLSESLLDGSSSRDFQVVYLQRGWSLSYCHGHCLEDMVRALLLRRK